MFYDVIPSMLSFGLYAGIALFVGFKGSRRLENLGFAIGMIGISFQELRALLIGLSLGESLQLHWEKIGLFGQTLTGAGWLLFSMTFVREDTFRPARKWGAFLSVYCLATIPFFLYPLTKTSGLPERLLITRAGYFFTLLYLATSVFILVNIKRIFRSASTLPCFKIKHLILGLGVVLAIEIYRSSQTLLFSAIDIGILPLYAIARIMACALILFSIVHYRLLNIDLFVSRYIIYKSTTFLAIGCYLGLVSLIVMGIQRSGGGSYIQLIPIVIFVALLGMVILLLSEGLRQRVKVFINVNFFKNKHDYRIKWQEFTRLVGGHQTLSRLLPSLVQWLAKTIGSDHVAIWLLDSERKRYYLASRLGFAEAPSAWGAEGALIRAIKGSPTTLILKKGHRLFKDVRPAAPNFLASQQVTAWIPIRSGQEMTGVIGLGSKMTGDPYDYHDLELLMAIADQAVGQIQRVHLIEELAVVRELKAIHTLSSFFLHDLKNYASTLFLLAQNAEIQGKPDLQEYTLKTINETVDKMNQLIQHITVVAKGQVLSKSNLDLNHLVEETLSGLSGALGLRGRLYSIFGDLPEFHGDSEQLANVIRNLVINAYNASKGEGNVNIETWAENRHVYLSVSDQGCGMSESFIATKLFKPLRTSKAAGWGIGLFQCQQIVRAHGGKIQVKSQEREGSTFTVELPLDES